MCPEPHRNQSEESSKLEPAALGTLGRLGISTSSVQLSLPGALSLFCSVGSFPPLKLNQAPLSLDRGFGAFRFLPYNFVTRRSTSSSPGWWSPPQCEVFEENLEADDAGKKGQSNRHRSLMSYHLLIVAGGH